MRKFVVIFVLIGALVAPLPATYAQRKNSKATAATSTASARQGAEQITAAQLRDYLFFIASDEMEGRDTPSRGLDIAAKFIATNLSRWGVFKPAGDDGSYFQKIKLRRDKLDTSQTRAEINGRSFNSGEDFMAQPNPGTASGPLVFVGHGWVIKSKNMNPYEGVDVKDKIMVVSGGDSIPKGVAFADLSGKRGEDWLDPVIYAQKNGAKGIIVLPNFQTLASWEQQRQRLIERGSLAVEDFRGTQNNPTVPSILVSPRMAAVLFQGEKQNANVVFSSGISGEAIAAFDFSPDKKVSFTVAAKPEAVMTQNVVAILEGSDPVLKNEYVAVGAHYDHVGIGPPVNGDAIYNGADDDGSGTVAVLSLAEAFAKGPRPKRSLLFVWHAGEEKGLWGSRYIVNHPPVPINQIITQLNIDMIGRSKKDGDTNPRNKELSGPNEIYVIGSKMMSTELGELSERVNSSYLNMTFNYKYDDPKDPNGFFFRSDHFNYAQKGIPIIFYFDGEHEDYHLPGDSPDKIDYQKMEKVTRTIYMTASEIANLKSRPRVDKQLPTELMRR